MGQISLAEPSQLGKPSLRGRARQALAGQLCWKPMLQELNVMAWDDCFADGLGWDEIGCDGMAWHGMMYGVMDGAGWHD